MRNEDDRGIHTLRNPIRSGCVVVTSTPRWAIGTEVRLRASAMASYRRLPPDISCGYAGFLLSPECHQTGPSLLPGFTCLTC
jgi:hypothetical protein